jgi:adenosylcobinamide-GDP ribazoletransferase
MDFLRTWGRRLALSIQFLTRIPMKKNMSVAEGDLPAAAVFFPLAGIIVGVAGLLSALAAGLLTQSAGGMAAAAGLGGTLLTGGLHLDGLADACDGVFSGRPRDRALEIMRDSRVGAFGVMASCSRCCSRFCC